MFLFFVFSHTSSAADIKAGEITFSLDTQVKDSSGNYSNGNFIKIVDGQDVSLRAIFKLTGPAEGLNIYSDNTKSDKIIYGDLTAPIVGLSVQILPVSDPSSANSGVQAGASSAAIAAINNTHINVNEEKTFNITIPWNQISSSLKLQDKAFGSNTPNFLVAPVLQLNGSPSFWTSFKAGLAGGLGAGKIIVSNSSVAFTPQKRVYAKIYSSVAEAGADTTVPKDVPGYGGVSGNLEKPVSGSGIAALINEIIGVLLGFFQELIYQVFFYLIAPLIQAVLSIQVYTDTFAAVIYPGWEVVRNICNIFFVVALIVIALATLFRVDSYQFRSLLVQLILAALLVNFSLVIAQAILGLADTIQAQFLPSNVEVIRSLAKDLMVKTYRDVYYTNAFSEGSFSGIVKPLFFLALAMGSFAVFAAIAVFLVIRIVALWVLLLISPMAYAVGVLPSTAGYRKQWWDMFLKYAFFTPIMAFFLNLTAVIANTYNTNPILQQINSPELQAQLGGSTIATFVFKVASNILLLVFLMAALKVADMAGVMGAGAITSVAQKGILAPFAGVAELGKRGAGYVSRKRDEISSHLVEGRKVGLGKKIAFTLINPGAVIKGYEKRSEELKHAAQGEAEAVGLMVVEQTMSKGKAFNRKAIAERAHDADFLKNYGDLTREEAINTAFDVATMANNMDGRAARRAIIEANMQEGWIDDIIMEAQENGQGKELIAKMKSLKSKQYRITDRDFEVSEVKDKEGNIIYEKKEDGSFKLDDKGNKIAKTKRNLKYNEKTRRALYLAMFGEHISKVVDKDGHEHEHVAIADQTAAKMIADGGEKYGRSTRHAEYMANQVYDTEANNKEGGYGFYDLEYATEIQDDDGTTHKVVDGYAVDGQYKGQLITKVNAGAVHARREVAKMGSREQAGIAHHALMDISNGKLDKEMFRVSSKALMDSPGFAQERTANYLMTGTDDIERLNDITKKYWETGTLDVDEASMQRIRDMYSVSPEATEIVLRKFLNKTNAEGVNEVRARGLKIKFKKPDGTVEEKNIIPDTPIKSK